MVQDEKFRVVFTGGGSGGHVYPLIAVTEELFRRLKELNAPSEFIYIGPKDAYAALFKNEGIDAEAITSGKIRRYFSFENILDVPKFLIGIIQALFKLYAIMPDVVFSKGGTGALAVVVAAWFYRIPVVIHESDARPGLTNLASARFAKKIFISFESAGAYFNPGKTELSGTPVRATLTENKTTKELAKENLGFDPKLPLTLVLGGSQGSVRVNDFILKNLKGLITFTQVLHQTGAANFEEVKKLSRAALMDISVTNRYEPVNYLTDNLAIALTAADLVVARAGSGSIFEIAAFGIPSILIPLAESANDHQRENAYEFAKTGAGVVIEESNLLTGIFLGEAKQIIADGALRQKMGVASSAFYKPQAAEVIAEAIIQIGA